MEYAFGTVKAFADLEGKSAGVKSATKATTAANMVKADRQYCYQRPSRVRTCDL